MDALQLYETAYRFYQSGHFKEAEQFFRLLTLFDMSQLDYWMGLGAAQQMQRKWKEATETYGAVAMLDRDHVNPLPHAYAAQCLFMLEDKVRASQALNAAKEICNNKKKYKPLLDQLTLLEEQW